MFFDLRFFSLNLCLENEMIDLEVWMCFSIWVEFEINWNERDYGIGYIEWKVDMGMKRMKIYNVLDMFWGFSFVIIFYNSNFI